MTSAVVALSIVLFSGLAVVQTQEWRTEDNTRRLEYLESIRIDSRMAVLENRHADHDRRIGQMETLLYAVLAVAIGQLVLSGSAFLKGRKRDDD